METAIFDSVHDETYRQMRQAPSLGSPHYIHLSDLLMGLKAVTQEAHGTWLDYGAGASPYRFLFPDCHYVRADVSGPDLDHHIHPGEPLDIPANTFDGILSTQVLEHVEDAAAYLADCWRLLKPGGTLILSTHGTWKEHAAPHDYWRWTEWGMRTRLAEANLRLVRLARVSSGPRAVLNCMFSGSERKIRFIGQGVSGWMLDLCFRWIYRNKKLIHRLSDTVHRDHRVVWDQQEAFYLVLLVVAQKPTDSA